MQDREIFERRVGTVLRGKWTLERLLGVGGMAAVYLGVHKIGRREAIKILHPEVAKNRELRERFEQEAHAVNRLEHPGAVKIRDVDVTEDGSPFLVMELLEGENLSERARRQNGLPLDELLGYVDELLDVLAAAHAQGIVHRDIKLDNLFVQKDGRLKVLDFGIARMRHGAAKMLTRMGARLGTVAYMPPEQVRGLEIDHRADLFAVGATMFRVIAKRRIHDAGNEADLIVKMASIPAPPLASVASDAPHAVCLVVDRALAFHRDRRYPDARTMQADVRAARRGQDPPWAAARLAAGDIPSEREAPPGAPDLSRPFEPGTSSTLVDTPPPPGRAGTSLASQIGAASLDATIAHGARASAGATRAALDPTRADIRNEVTQADPRNQPAHPAPSPLAASVQPGGALTGAPPAAAAQRAQAVVVMGAAATAPASGPPSSTSTERGGPGASGRGAIQDSTLPSAMGSGPVSAGAHSTTSPTPYAPLGSTGQQFENPPSVAVLSAPIGAGAAPARPQADAGARGSEQARRTSALPLVVVGAAFLVAGGLLGAWVALGSESSAEEPARAEDRPTAASPPADPASTAQSRIAPGPLPKPTSTNVGQPAPVPTSPATAATPARPSSSPVASPPGSLPPPLPGATMPATAVPLPSKPGPVPLLPQSIPTGGKHDKHDKQGKGDKRPGD